MTIAIVLIVVTILVAGISYWTGYTEGRKRPALSVAQRRAAFEAHIREHMDLTSGATSVTRGDSHAERLAAHPSELQAPDPTTFPTRAAERER